MNPWPISIFAIVISWLSAIEIGKMLGPANAAPPLQGLLVFVGVPYLLSSAAGRQEWMWMATVGFLSAIITITVFVRTKRLPLLGALAAGLWSTGAMICLLVIHEMRSVVGMWDFRNPILMATLPLWLGDSAAFLVGKSFGRIPLAPAISPSKTLEGSLTNLIVCVAFSIALGMWVKISVLASILCGLSAGFIGQAGDLFESWVKRGANLKDSSELLPGHGGVMDRLDSLLFNAPAVAIILTYMAS